MGALEATPLPVEPMGWTGANGDELIPSGHSVHVGRFKPQAVAALLGNVWTAQKFFNLRNGFVSLCELRRKNCCVV